MEYMWTFNGIHIYFASNNIVERILVQDDVKVGGQLKMATWNPIPPRFCRAEDRACPTTTACEVAYLKEARQMRKTNATHTDYYYYYLLLLFIIYHLSFIIIIIIIISSSSSIIILTALGIWFPKAEKL